MCQDNPPDTWGQLGTRGGIAGKGGGPPTHSISLAPPTPLLASDMPLDDQMVTFQTMRSLDTHQQQPAQLGGRGAIVPGV